MNQTTKDLLPKVEAHLEKLSSELIDELTTIVHGNWGLNKSTTADRVSQLDIEVFVDSYRLVLYPMDASSTQLGHRSLLPAYAEGLINDEELTPNLDLYDFTNTGDIQELDEFDAALQEIFTHWFVKCWNEVDSSSLKQPVYLLFHDASESVHLNAK
jgi:hypothetical protein